MTRNDFYNEILFAASDKVKATFAPIDMEQNIYLVQIRKDGEIISVQFYVDAKALAVQYGFKTLGLMALFMSRYMPFKDGVRELMSLHAFNTAVEYALDTDIKSGTYTPTYTYLMKDDQKEGYYKIGRSKNPQYREQTLAHTTPHISTVATCNKDIESILHKKYAKQRLRGEWFLLLPEDILDVIATMKSANEEFSRDSI